MTSRFPRSTRDIRALPELASLRQLVVDDVDQLIALTEACREADAIETVPTPENLRLQFDTPGIEFAGNAFVLEDASGTIIANVVTIPLPGAERYHIQLQGAVRPDHRADGLEDRLMEFGIANSHEWQQRTGHAMSLQAGCRASQSHYIELFGRHGFTPIRYFHTLERDLSRLIDDAPMPANTQIRSINVDADFEAMHRVLHDSFQDHFNPVNFTAEQTRHWLSMPENRPHLMLLAFGEDENGSMEPAAICLNHVRTNYNLQHGKREGEVGALGVRREFRRKGLARSILTQSLQLLRAEELDTAILSVDSENPLGATQLYASVGFTQRETAIVFEHSN